MNRSIIDKIRSQYTSFHKILILNPLNYSLLKQELGMDELEELEEFKGLIICISKKDQLTLLLV